MTVKSRLLEMLEKYKGEVISGERIAGELGCTRAAVWKAVKSLREDGYIIEAGPNKGYMLAKDTNRLSQEGIRLFLDDPHKRIIQSCHILLSFIIQTFIALFTQRKLRNKKRDLVPMSVFRRHRAQV